jgi:hypothetical protein
MNILLQLPDKEFFTFYKEKKRWHVLSNQKPLYTSIQAFVLKLMRLNGAFKKLVGKVFLRKFNQGKFEFGPRGEFSNIPHLKNFWNIWTRTTR